MNEIAFVVLILVSMAFIGMTLSSMAVFIGTIKMPDLTRWVSLGCIGVFGFITYVLIQQAIHLIP